jgi:hypothetical protein
MNDKVTIELTRQEHTMITAILMMHHTGLIVNVHQDKRPMLGELAERFSMKNIEFMLPPH